MASDSECENTAQDLESLHESRCSSLPSDSLDSQSEPESEQCRIVPGKPFPKLVQQLLKSLYERGMIGWGRKHAAAVVVAMETTGLTENQVKVCYVLGNLYALKQI